MIRVKCNKNLISEDNNQYFTKGKIYVSNYSDSLNEQTTLINDHNELHKAGNWAKHFKRL